jgi:uncharacterized protein
VAAVELARGPDIATVAARLVEMGVARSQQSSEVSLRALQRDLQPKPGCLNNLYLHVTFRCQLNCTHCYARADAYGPQQSDMPVEAVVRLVREAKDAGFRQVVITGGEPLVHHWRDELLAELVDLRLWAAPMNLVLRTNLAMPLSKDDLRRIGMAVDQVVVSVDGNQETHDARRGPGSYVAAVHNLETYTDLFSLRDNAGKGDAHDQASPSEILSLQSPPGEPSLACVMSAADIQGEPGESVQALAARLGIRRTRFRPLLPLGRAADWDEPPASEALGAHTNPMELVEGGFRPVASCGLGQNLYVEPSGESFPCYAYHQCGAFLGNVITRRLAAVLGSTAFGDLSSHTVDTNAKCRQCDLRYLCGGACRAWGGATTQQDLDAPPVECEGLQRRAEALVTQAAEYLGIQARAGGLPCSRG